MKQTWYVNKLTKEHRLLINENGSLENNSEWKKVVADEKGFIDFSGAENPLRYNARVSIISENLLHTANVLSGSVHWPSVVKYSPNAMGDFEIHSVPPSPPEPPYASLQRVLDLAYKQAAEGKGKERHAQDLPFEHQPIQSISRLVGSSDGLAYQAIKKVQESVRLPTKERKINELLGAINYVAAMIIFIENKE